MCNFAPISNRPRNFSFHGDTQTHLLKSGTTFEKVLKLHDFDVALRALISQWLQKIEVSLRTQMSQVMAEATDQFWHINPVN